MDPITQLEESQFNGQESTAAHACLLAANIQASIDSLGLDNLFRERLSRTVNSENMSLTQHDLELQQQTDLTAYFDIYSLEKRHPTK